MSPSMALGLGDSATFCVADDRTSLLCGTFVSLRNCPARTERSELVELQAAIVARWDMWKVAPDARYGYCTVLYTYSDAIQRLPPLRVLGGSCFDCVSLY